MKKELANLRKPSMTSSWRLKNLGVAAKKKKSEPKNKEKKFDNETKLKKAKLEQKLEKKIDEKRDQNINAKLPKLVITKFKGTPTDWLASTGNEVLLAQGALRSALRYEMFTLPKTPRINLREHL